MKQKYSENIDSLAQTRKLDEALTLALEWTKVEQSSKSWSKLSYVYNLQHNLEAAHKAAYKALEISPNHPALLFKLGGIEYSRHEYHDAAKVFQQCAIASQELDSTYYHDAALIAQAKSLCCFGLYDEAQKIIESVDVTAATWLDGRITASQLQDEIMSYQNKDENLLRMRM